MYHTKLKSILFADLKNLGVKVSSYFNTFLFRDTKVNNSMNLKECLHEIQGFLKMLLDVMGVLSVFTIINVNCVK